MKKQIPLPMYFVKQTKQNKRGKATSAVEGCDTIMHRQTRHSQSTQTQHAHFGSNIYFNNT